MGIVREVVSSKSSRTRFVLFAAALGEQSRDPCKSAVS